MFSSGTHATQLIEMLDQYQQREGDLIAAKFQDFARTSFDVFQRWHPPGHFTGSAWVVSADGQRALLMHHRKLDRWLQPGGHADGDPDLSAVALREAQEETGLEALALESSEIFDLDLHTIPARGTEPEHQHWDVRFVVRASGNERFVVNAESHALAWVPIKDLLGDQTEVSIRRMAQRWLQR